MTVVRESPKETRVSLETSDALRRELGQPPAAYLERLSAAQRAALLAAVLKAKRHEREALDGAIVRAMGFVPALLRAPLKRILFP